MYLLNNSRGMPRSKQFLHAYFFAPFQLMNSGTLGLKNQATTNTDLLRRYAATG